MLAARVEELDGLGNPTIAFQASGIDGIKVRVVAKCDDEPTAQRILDAEEKIIRALLGDVIFGIDEQSMEVVVLDRLRRKGLTLAAAETLTGGLLASRLSAADPAMEIFRGATISRDAPGSGQSSLEQRSAAAADAARAAFATDVGLAAITGERSGEGRNRIVPVFLTASIGQAQAAEKVVLPADPRRLRDFAVIGLLNLLRRNLAA